MTVKISHNMQQTNQEINETVQTASHRIYNHMLKNIELNKECNQIDMIRKNSQNESNSHTIINPEIDPHNNDKMKMKLQEISISGISKTDKPPKPPRPPPPLAIYQIPDDKSKLQQNNAICNLDLSEGEVVASKLQDRRLIKRLSKSLASDLNGQMIPSSALPKLSSENSEQQKNLDVALPTTTVGIVIKLIFSSFHRGISKF